MKSFFFVISVILFTLLAFSCGQQHQGFERIDDVYVKYHIKSEDGQKPMLNDWVTLDLIYRFEDTVLFNSEEMGEPMVFPMILPTFQGDLYAGLTLLNVGDSVTFVFPADSFYMKTAGYPELPDFIEPNTDMFFDVKLLKIQNQQEMDAEKSAQFKELREQEKIILQAYLDEQNITVEPKPSGLYVIEQKRGTGRLPREGDMLRLHFTIEMLDGLLLFSSFDQDPIDVEFGSEFDTEGFSEGIGYMRKGGKASLIVPSHLAYDSVGVPQVLPPFTPLIYNLELLDILSLEQVEQERIARAEAEERVKEQARLNEPALIQDYLNDHQYDVEPLPSGLYFIEMEQGNGAPATEGSTVEVHYTLYNIYGKPLQSSKEMGQTFELQVGVGQVIRGWDEGLQLMREGGKARLIIPSDLAYGASRRGEDIPPYSPLVFDVEMIKVK